MDAAKACNKNVGINCVHTCAWILNAVMGDEVHLAFANCTSSIHIAYV